MTVTIESVDGDSRRFRRATDAEEKLALAIARPDEAPDVPLPRNARYSGPPLFGFETQADLYTNRQLVSLVRFAAAIRDVESEVLGNGGTSAQASTIAALLGLCVGKLAQYASSQALLGPTTSSTRFQSGFTRNDIPMTWDFCEVNPFAASGGPSLAAGREDRLARAAVCWRWNRDGRPARRA